MTTQSQDNAHSIKQTARFVLFFCCISPHTILRLFRHNSRFFSAAKSDGRFGKSLRDRIKEYLSTDDPNSDIIACLCFCNRSKFFQRRGCRTFYSALAWTIYHQNTDFWIWMQTQPWFHQRRLERSIICRSEKKTISSWTPILLCVKTERHTLLRLLLQHFNPNIGDIQSGIHPLMLACAKADLHSVRPLVLCNDTDFFETDNDDCSILHRTGKGKDVMFTPQSTWCFLLTQERCDLDFINEQDRFGMTPLHYVTYYKRKGWHSNILILLTFGAKDSLEKKTNSKGKVPFDFLNEMDAMLFTSQLENEEFWRCMKRMICGLCVCEKTEWAMLKDFLAVRRKESSARVTKRKGVQLCRSTS